MCTKSTHIDSDDYYSSTDSDDIYCYYTDDSTDSDYYYSTDNTDSDTDYNSGIIEKLTNMIQLIATKITTFTSNIDVISAVYELKEIVESYLPNRQIYKNILVKCESIMLKFSIDMCDEFSELITTLIDTTSKLM